MPGWTYRTLKTSRSGVGNATARSRTFTVSKTQRYFVGVFLAGPSGAPGELILCAELNTPKAKKHPAKPAKPGMKPSHPGTKPSHPATPAEPAEPAKPDKPRGKSDDAPRGNANGHDKDKPKEKGKPSR